MEASVQPARGHPDYVGLVDQITSMVTAMVPPGETVLMVSKGDEALLRLGSRRGWHFPRLSDGRYAGYYPADSDDAIRQLEELRERGAGYIVFPATSLWWLDHYPDLSRHLESRYQSVVRDEQICAIYALGDSPAAKTRPSSVRVETGAHPARRLAVSADQLNSFLDSILPDEATVAVVSSGDESVLQLRDRRMWHFPRDPSGAYAGQNPANSDIAIDQLEGLRSRGLEFLVVPRETPWLSNYPDFIGQVEQRYRCVARQRYLCTVFDLSGAQPVATGASESSDERSPWRRWFGARDRAGESEQG